MSFGEGHEGSQEEVRQVRLIERSDQARCPFRGGVKVAVISRKGAACLPLATSHLLQVFGIAIPLYRDL